MIFLFHIQALRSPSHIQKFHSVLKIPLSSFFNSSSAWSHPHACAYSSKTNPFPKSPLIFDYLVQTLNFSKTDALSVSKRFPLIDSTTNIQKTVSFLRSFGFSDSQLVSTIVSSPRVLFVSIEKNLKPKLTFLQELGFSGANLGDFVSKRPSLLNHSLEKKLKPCVTIIKEVLENGGNRKIDKNNNKDLLFILSRCDWLVPSTPRLSSNISHLKSFGISGTDLSNLLKRQPRVFILNEVKLRNNISEVLDMGFETGSQMFIHAIRARCSVSNESFKKKFELFESFGISRNEVLGMFRKAPNVMKLSEAKLKSEIEFLLRFPKLEKYVLINRPVILLFSMENRVLPRYRVLEVIKSKGLLEKEPKFRSLLQLSNERFLEKYVLGFGDYAEELLMAYEGQPLDFSKEEGPKCKSFLPSG